VVLVTGAQHGIGRAMALEFAAIGINLKGSCADIAINCHLARIRGATRRGSDCQREKREPPGLSFCRRLHGQPDLLAKGELERMAVGSAVSTSWGSENS
jgi:hypothetical protein